MMTIDPGKSIVPIMKLGRDEKLSHLLGTAFFVGSIPAVVTAKHVFVNNPLSEGEKYCMVLLDSFSPPKLKQIGDIIFSEKYDIAIFGAKGVSGVSSLKIARTEWPNTQDVFTLEFSSTQIAESYDGRRSVTFIPFTHKGNVMCYYDSDYPETNLPRVFEVSFPVLQGASGAPVVRSIDFAVIGMLVACRERELTPAQIVTIKEADKSTVEYRYFLPAGKAIASSVLIDFLSSENCALVEPDIVD